MAVINEFDLIKTQSRELTEPEYRRLQKIVGDNYEVEKIRLDILHDRSMCQYFNINYAAPNMKRTRYIAMRLYEKGLRME